MEKQKREQVTQMTLRLSIDQRTLISEVATKYELSQSECCSVRLTCRAQKGRYGSEQRRVGSVRAEQKLRRGR